MNQPTATDLTAKFNLFQDYWHPRIVAELNGQLVKVAKGLGTLPMHKHDHEDEMFLIHKGTLTLEFADGSAVDIQEGQFYVVPKGVLHRPVADQEVQLVLFEPADTKHTGELIVKETKVNLERI